MYKWIENSEMRRKAKAVEKKVIMMMVIVMTVTVTSYNALHVVWPQLGFGSFSCVAHVNTWCSPAKKNWQRKNVLVKKFERMVVINERAYSYGCLCVNVCMYMRLLSFPMPCLVSLNLVSSVAAPQVPGSRLPIKSNRNQNIRRCHFKWWCVYT